MLTLIISCSNNPLGDEKDIGDVTPPMGATITGWVWSLSSPNEGSVSNDYTPVIDLNGAGEENGSKVQIYSNATCSESRGGLKTIRNGMTNHSDITFNADGADDGMIHFYAIVTDEAGNSSECTDIELEYQLAAGVPVVGFHTSVAINQSNVSSYDISGTCSEPGQDVMIDIGGISPALIPVCGANNTWSVLGMDLSALADGAVVASADHSDIDTNPAITASINLTKDTIAPSIGQIQAFTWTLSSPVAGVNSNDGTPIITLSGAGSEEGGSVSIYTDAGICSVGVEEDRVISSGGYIFNTINLSSDGLSSFHARVTDVSGNISACTDISLSYTLDTVDPTVAFNVTPNISGANQNNYTLSGTCSEFSTGESVVLDIGGIAPGSQPICSGAGVWTLPSLNLSGLTDGQITITATHADVAGNSVIITANIIKDTTAPTMSEVQAFTWALTSPAFGTTSNDITPAINLSNAAAENGASVQIYDDGICSLARAQGALQTVTAGLSEHLDITYPGDGSADGVISFYAVMTDSFGNISPCVDISLSYTLDTISPIAAVVQGFTWVLASPTNGSTSSNTMPIINLSGAGAEEGSSARIFKEAACLAALGTPQVINSGVSAHNDILFSTDGSDDGAINFYATITDVAGNSSPCVDISQGYLLDTQSPAVTISAAVNIGAGNVASYSLNGTCSEVGQPVTVSVGGVAPAVAPICTGALSWSLSGLDVSSLSDGNITILADHEDLGGNDAPQASQTIIKDTTAPTVLEVQAFAWSLSSPAGGSVSNDNTPVVNLSGAASVTGGSSQIYDDASCTSAKGILQAITAGAATHSSINYLTNGIDDGLIEFYAVITDAGGNVSPCSHISLSYTLDTSLPSVAITLSPNINSSNISSYAFSGTCSEIGQPVVVNVGGVSPAVAPNCSGSLTWSVSGLNVSSLSDGGVTILADHQDASSNNAPQASVGIIKDTTGPATAVVQGYTWTLTSPANGSTSSDNTPELTLAGAGVEDGGSVQVYTNNTCSVTAGALQTIASGATSHTDISFVTNGSADGLKNFYVVMRDAVGNPSACVDISRSYTFDTTGPTLAEVQALTWTLSSPANGSNSPDIDPVINLSGATSLNGGSVQIYDHMSCSSAVGASQTITSGSTNHNDILYVTGGVDDGLKSFYAVVTDSSGNDSVCADISLSYTLDTAPPAVAITSSPAIGAANQTTYAASGTCSEASEDVVVSVGGITVSPTPTCSVSNTWSISNFDASSLPDGSVIILADHQDASSNSAPQASVSVAKDTTAPTSITITSWTWAMSSPALMSTSSDGTPLITLSGAAAEEGASVQIFADATCTTAKGVSAVIATGSTSHSDISFLVNGTEDGLIRFYAVVTDLAGNASPCTDVGLSYTLDTTAPTTGEIIAFTWTLSSPANGSTSNDNTPIMNLSGASSEIGASVQLYRDATCSATIGSPQLVTAGLTTHNDLVYATDGSDDGANRFYVRMTDASGNLSGCANISRLFYLDTTPPTVAITDSPDITTSSAPSYSFSGTCSEFGRPVIVSVGGISPAVQPNCAGGFLWSVSGLDVSALPDGNVTITADHTDASTNAAIQASVVVNKDVEGPTDPSSLIATGWASENRSRTLSWTASVDDGFVDYYEISLTRALDNVVIVSGINIGNVLTYTIEDGVDGASFTLVAGVSYYMSVKAVDNEGHDSGLARSPAFSFFRPINGGSLKVWLASDDLNTLYQDPSCTTPATGDGDPVGCWQNKASFGGFMSVSGSARALRDSSGDTLEFDGVDDGGYVFSQGSIAKTVFMMGRLDPGYTPLAGLFTNAGNTSTQNFRVDSDCFRGNNAHGEDAADFRFGSSTPMRVDGATGECLTLGEPFIVYGESPSFISFVPQIGQTASSRFWRGGVHEVIVYDNTLDIINTRKVEGYLACKWNTRNLLPVSHPYYHATLGNLSGCP